MFKPVNSLDCEIKRVVILVNHLRSHELFFQAKWGLENIFVLQVVGSEKEYLYG